jgi:hypothetical protein
MIDLEDDGTLRNVTLAMGVATAAFGGLAVLVPGTFARLFGLPDASSIGTASSVRAIGVRDAITGAGLASAALHGGKIAPWLLTRMVVDGFDAVNVGSVFARGAGNRALGTLGLLALGAAVLDTLLWRAAKEAAQQAEELGLDY